MVSVVCAPVNAEEVLSGKSEVCDYTGLVVATTKSASNQVAARSSRDSDIIIGAAAARRQLLKTKVTGVPLLNDLQNGCATNEPPLATR